MFTTSALEIATNSSTSSAACTIAGIAMLAAFGILAARFIFLQVVQHDHYRGKAEENQHQGIRSEGGSCPSGLRSAASRVTSLHAGRQ